MLNMSIIEEACEQVGAALPPLRPACVLVLGSGWGGVIGHLDVVAGIDYADIPCLGATQIAGHDGQLVLVEWQGIPVVVFQGRRHWYEGLGWNPVVLPVLLGRHLGADVLLLTNAAGGIRGDLDAGSLMLIDDHINAMYSNPLIGPHHPELGGRFPDQSEVYDRSLLDMLDRAGEKAGVPVSHGVYLATPGPVYETPAEIAAFRVMGADAVGMSTVPEATVASASGMRVAGISFITNRAADSTSGRLCHTDVIDATREAEEELKSLLAGFFELLAKSDILHDEPGHNTASA